MMMLRYVRKSIRRSSSISIAIMLLSTIFAACGMVGCQQEGPTNEEIAIKAASVLVTTAIATVKTMDAEIATMDSELTDVETKLLKVEQIAKPALQWFELMKTKAQQEQWNARTLEVTDSLSKMKNDQYQVVKLQFVAEFLTAGMRYSSVIQIDELAIGKITSYEVLRDNLKKQVADMLYQREARAKARNLTYLTTLDMKEAYRQWKTSRIDNVTYRISGVGLGVAQGVATTGTWSYNTETEKVAPLDEEAANLQKVLSGQ